MTTLTALIVAIVGIAAGTAAGYVLAAQRAKVLEAEARMLQRQSAQQRTDHERQLEQLAAEHQRRTAQLRTDHDRQLRQLHDAHDAQLLQLRDAHDRQLGDLRADHARQLQQQMELMRQQIRTATEQLRTMSEDVLRSRSEELQTANAQQLGHIIEPLRNSLRDMQQTAARQEEAHAEKMARLDETIKATLRQTASVSESADRLATALTSENKTQGNFGELQLKTLLDNMGLQEGLQYETQVTLRDDAGTVIHDPDNGQRLQPDFLIHFPEGRDLVIDSKMSLTAFADYFAAADDATRAEAVRRHVQSVRSHVDELSAKKYFRYITGSRQTVDFVVMYLYSDSALQLAMSADPQLWDDAARKGVLITGSHNLYMMLRIVVMAWERMRQSENQQKIMEQANLIISRVQTFYGRLLDVEAQLQKTQQAFDALKTTTADRGTSIITPARTLIRLGAREDKARGKKLLPRAEEEE